MPSKKLLVIGAVVLMLVGGAGAGFMYMQNAKHEQLLAEEEDSEDADTGKATVKEVRKEHAPVSSEPPVYVPLESLVANVKDPSGTRMAQMSITLVVDNVKTQERMKLFIPSIRSGLLLLVSEYSGDELLGREGKERLKKDIANVTRKSMGLPEVDTVREGEDVEKAAEATKAKGSKKEPRRKKMPPSPIQDVLFSSFIVQQ